MHPHRAVVPVTAALPDNVQATYFPPLTPPPSSPSSPPPSPSAPPPPLPPSQAFLEYAAREEAKRGMTLTRSLLEDSTSLTQKQAGLVEEIETILSEPLAPAVPPPQRSPERTRASKELHKRTNPAFVDLPYRSRRPLSLLHAVPQPTKSADPRTRVAATRSTSNIVRRPTGRGSTSKSNPTATFRRSRRLP